MKRLNIIIKNHVLFVLFALVLGAMAGAVVWIFCALMNIGIELIWNYLPNALHLPFFYPIVFCVLGGLILGLFQHKFGIYPETLTKVMQRVGKEHRYPYNNIWVIFFAALLPLIFGASIGPEAGLTGAIAGLCTWIGDRFKYAGKETKNLAQIGTAATLSVVFGAAPLFGLLSPLELSGENSENIIPKTSKIIIYLSAILGALFSFGGLNVLLPFSEGFPRFDSPANVGTNEILWLIPIAFIGVLAGLLYFVAVKLVNAFFGLFKSSIIGKALFGGLLLGLGGCLLPYTMFSGEHQMGILMTDWQQIGFWILLLTGIIKLFMVNICVSSGFRGGNIFPVVFSGVSIAYALALVLPVDPIFTVTILTASLTGTVMRKPLLVVLVLLICFPVDSILFLFIAVIIGCTIPVPKFLRDKKELTKEEESVE